MPTSVKWIPYRGVNGEYGWLNLKTNKFQTNKPDELSKQRKATLVTHSAKQAKYERTDAKRRNHSDETVKKSVSVPIMTMNPDGTFTNNYVQQMAPSESSIKQVSPEFDILNIYKIINPTKRVLDILSRKKTYTGVPHNLKSNGTFMDESFLKSKNNYDIWTSDNYDFVQQYASNGGQTFAVFGKSNKLYSLPKLNKGIAVHWRDMPYKINGNKIRINPSIKTINYNGYVYGNINPIKMYRTQEYENMVRNLEVNPLGITTDDLLKAVPEKYQGIKFKNILDGPIITSDGYADIPVNEWVYRAGADVIKAPLNTTKLDLIKNNLVDISTSMSNVIGHNIIKNDK